MGYIIRNGIKYFGDNAVELTQAQYDALPSSKLTDGVDYYITDTSKIIKNGIEYFGDNAVELTQAEYDALSFEQKNNGTLYVIKDAPSIIDIIYPVGSIYMSVNNVNPSTYLTGTTWEVWGSGRVPVGVDTSQTEFDTVEETGGAKSNSYTPAGSNSGTAVTMNAVSLSHSGGAVQNTTLTIDQIPAHKHALPYRQGILNSAIGTSGAWFTDPGTKIGSTDAQATSVGGGKAHGHGFTQPSAHSFTPTTKTVTNPKFTGAAANISTVQPYITCYMWKRTH
jgi:hypothetical protein